MLDSLYAQPLSKSFVYPPFHTPYISSPNHCLLFTTHAHTIANCFAVVPRLCHLFLVSQFFTRNSLLPNFTHPSDHSHLCPLKCHLIFFPYRPGFTSCNILLHTQLLYSLPFIHTPHIHACACTHTQPFMALLDFVRDYPGDSEWQWYHLGHMQICTLTQTHDHTSIPPLSFIRPDALPAAQPLASKHWRQKLS